MSHFYGTLQGARGACSRCGTKRSGITTYAASWSGAVRVMLVHDEASGADMAHVALVPWHGIGTRRDLYCGPVDEELIAEQTRQRFVWDRSAVAP